MTWKEFKHKFQQRRWEWNNKEKRRAQQKLRAQDPVNKEKHREQQRRYYRKNRHKYFEWINKRKQRLKNHQTPKWLTLDQLAEIKETYHWALVLTELLNEPVHVDHIVPLNHPLMSGLHVPWNLQLLLGEVNLAKRNRSHK